MALLVSTLRPASSPRKGEQSLQHTPATLPTCAFTSRNLSTTWIVTEQHGFVISFLIHLRIHVMKFANNMDELMSFLQKSQKMTFNFFAKEPLIIELIFCKRATNYRALFRKITCKDKASYDSSWHPIVTRESDDFCVSVLSFAGTRHGI